MSKDLPAEHLPDIVEQIGTGLAIARLADWQIVLSNATFSRWFPNPGADHKLTACVETFDTQRATERLGSRGVFSFETESRGGSRPVPVAIDLITLSGPATGLISIECRDISKQRQAVCSRPIQKWSRSILVTCVGKRNEPNRCCSR